MDQQNSNTEWKYGKRTPGEVLLDVAKSQGLEITDENFAKFLDRNDELANLRKDFFYPKLADSGVEMHDNEDYDESIYFCGMSLGLQTKHTSKLISKVLQNWEVNTINCHSSGYLPAALCDDYVHESMSKIVGAYEDEVVNMNGLTVNLNFLLVSFYQPTPTRHKILLEGKAFPSDHYAIESQIKQRGYDPTKSMRLLKLREGENTWRDEDILKVIEEEGDEIALIMLSGLNYYNGQVFDMEAITRAGHAKGCMVGFDLAHAVGNIELHLHNWDVDFACWCTYKYLNSGPGGIAGAFMHRRHKNNDFPKFLGWWGHSAEDRFEMTNVMNLTPGIQGYRVSNPPPLLVASLRASLDIFDKTSMRQLREKSFLLTGYLEYLLQLYFSKDKSDPYIDIITPSDFSRRGCQLSLVYSCSITEIHEKLEKLGVLCDTRKPNVMRIAPTPMYNSFQDVFRFIQILKRMLTSH
ncbi:kynureninase-like [Clavelina lepadiformis]|uniref:Kynureninase n=1 Tax=Clavelina lepadiformis TaxID=159417 RepID=A0ABP0EW82_CLALP